MDVFATGYENIRMRGLIAGLTDKQIKAKVDEIAAFSGLGSYLAMPLKAYSSGMQGRLAFAVATSIESDVLLMDEWLSVGDVNFRAQAQERLMSLVQQSSIVVLASHDPTIIKSLCNKFMVLQGGQASEVYDVSRMDEIYSGVVGGTGSLQLGGRSGVRRRAIVRRGPPGAPRRLRAWTSPSSAWASWAPRSPPFWPPRATPSSGWT